MNKMDANWIEYKCKSGQTLFIYNKVTGEHKWPTNDSSEGDSVMIGHPVIYKELCTTGTQTDDKGCHNGCTSMYINAGQVTDSITSPQEDPLINEIKDFLGIKTGLDKCNGLDDGNGEGFGYLDECETVLEVCNSGMDANNMDTTDCNVDNEDSLANILSRLQEKHRNDASDFEQNQTSDLNSNEAEDNSIQDESSDVSSLQNSIQDKSSDGSSLQCSYCDKKFRYKSQITRHLKVHTIEEPIICSLGKRAMNKKNPFKCPCCQARFETDKLMKDHLRTHTGDNMCSYCKKTFAQRSNLLMHLKIHQRQKPFQCFRCKKKFAVKIQLDSHMRAKHVKKNKLFQCSHCKSNFSKKTALETHKKAKHTECMNANKMNTTDSNVDNEDSVANMKSGLQEKHINDASDLEKNKTSDLNSNEAGENSIQDKSTCIGVRSLQCSYCNKTFRYKSQITRHLKVHTKEELIKCSLGKRAMNKKNPFKCPCCQTRFETNQLMKDHLRTHTGDNMCSYCKKTFARKSNLLMHLKMHQRQKPFQCFCCKKKFAVKIQLDSHMRAKHVKNNKLFQCSHCSSKFIEERFLEMHIRAKHDTENKMFECSHCKSKFSEKKSLEKHVKDKHTEENKPFHCSQCKITFAEKKSLEMHEKSMHTSTFKVKPFQCSYCDMKFAVKRSLGRHVKTIHAKEVNQFQCSPCKMKFAEKKFWEVHMAMHTKDIKPFQCSHCKIRFADENVLKMHERAMHTRRIKSKSSDNK